MWLLCGRLDFTYNIFLLLFLNVGALKRTALSLGGNALFLVAFAEAIARQLQ